MIVRNFCFVALLLRCIFVCATSLVKDAAHNKGHSTTDLKRHLQLNVFGVDTVMVARVSTSDSSVMYQANDLRDVYFGTAPGSIALQYIECSAGQYTLVPDPVTGGVVELALETASVGLDMDEGIEAALRDAFEAAHGSVDSYGHVIYCLPTGFNAFRGYTRPETNEIWLHNEWCGYLSLPFHLIGSNLGLQQSNGADGREFGDQSCMMGLSYASSFGPRMCFNGHKFWALNWFSSYRLNVDPTVHAATSVDIVAFVDALKLGEDSPYTVVVRVGDLYMVFNRAKDYNEGTQANANQVTITTAPDFVSPSRILGGISPKSRAFSTTAFLGSGNVNLVIEYCDQATVNLADGNVDVMRVSVRTSSKDVQCDRITQLPSSAPSSTPSASPTQFPTVGGFLCNDDPNGDFLVPTTGRREPCIWLQARPDFLTALCAEGGEAWTACPETCGACSDKCSDSFDEFLVNNVFRDCAWLRIRPAVQQQVCVPGNDAYIKCQETCNACDARRTTAPSPMPSKRGEIAPPTVSPTATSTPSSIAPWCDDDPNGRFLVPFLGTTEPCIWLEARPEYHAELCLPGLPAYDLCEETCGKCRDQCEDTFGTFLINGVNRPCEWLKIRPGIQQDVCVPGSDAYETVCPETCDKCDGKAPIVVSPTPAPYCDDDPKGNFFAPTTGKREPCIWLQDRPFLIPQLCAKGSEARTVCRETCGSCSDMCEDTAGFFSLQGVFRDCEWLRIRPRVQRVVCIPGVDVYEFVCPETCGTCDGERRSPFPTPSPTITPYPSAAPSQAPTVFCDDNPDGRFFVPFLDTTEPCIWLAARPQYHAEFCQPGLPAYDICEETCGKCSDTCEDTDGTFVVNGVDRPCEWLLLRPGQQVEFCVPGSDAYETICPETCNKCDGEVAPPHSIASTINTVPTKPPTKRPLESPTSPPAPATESNPSGCDDDNERKFYVKSIDQEQGCLWLAARPIYQVVLCSPTDSSGAYHICQETCAKCFDDCEDTDGTFVVSGITRNCEWLRLREGQQPTLCAEGSEVVSICPETCNVCDDYITPSASPTFLVTSSPTSFLCDDTDGDFLVASTGKREDCIWLQARPELVSSLCTRGSETRVVCPETCGVCSDNCFDSDGTFMVDGVSRDCDWLRVRPGEQSTLCVSGTQAAWVCPETCNVCD